MQHPATDDAADTRADGPMPGIESLARLRARVAELERRNEQLDRFAATVAHELRAPLIAADGYLAMLEQGLGDALRGRARDDFDSVRRETARIRMLAETLLQQARSRAEPPAVSLVALDRVAAECIARLDAEIAASGAEVALAPLPVVKADAAMVAVVLMNLLGNALRYGLREGGVVRLSGRRAEGRARI